MSCSDFSMPHGLQEELQFLHLSEGVPVNYYKYIYIICPKLEKKKSINNLKEFCHKLPNLNLFCNPKLSIAQQVMWEIFASLILTLTLLSTKMVAWQLDSVFCSSQTVSECANGSFFLQLE